MVEASDHVYVLGWTYACRMVEASDHVYVLGRTYACRMDLPAKRNKKYVKWYVKLSCKKMTSQTRAQNTEFVYHIGNGAWPVAHYLIAL
jgi:hypothetical protein